MDILHAEQNKMHDEHMFFLLYIYRTRTPLIRVTYFSDFVNRFLKNIFEKILQTYLTNVQKKCYNNIGGVYYE